MRKWGPEVEIILPPPNKIYVVPQIYKNDSGLAKAKEREPALYLVMSVWHLVVAL